MTRKGDIDIFRGFRISRFFPRLSHFSLFSAAFAFLSFFRGLPKGLEEF